VEQCLVATVVLVVPDLHSHMTHSSQHQYYQQAKFTCQEILTGLRLQALSSQ